MKKTFPVVMLTTEKASLIIKDFNNKLIHNYNNTQFLREQYQFQHLYIISDDEIKNGDWYINGEFINQAKSNIPYTKYIKGKIVATTDTSLFFDRPYRTNYGGSKATMLPQIPESFLQAYIKSYNEGKPITEVDLEMRFDGMIDNFTTGLAIESYVIKTRPDNTVIVNQSKIYTREEVKQLCFQAFINHKCIDGKIKPNEAMELTIPFNKWIEENL